MCYNSHVSFVLQFPVTLEDVQTRTLLVSVWHSDMFGRNDFLGEVSLALKDMDLANPLPRWFSLQDRVCLLWLSLELIIGTLHLMIFDLAYLLVAELQVGVNNEHNLKALGKKKW